MSTSISTSRTASTWSSHVVPSSKKQRARCLTSCSYATSPRNSFTWSWKHHMIVLKKKTAALLVIIIAWWCVVYINHHQPSMQDHCKTISISDLLTYQSILCTLWLFFSHALTRRPDSTSKPHDLWRFLGARTESQPVLDPAMAEHCHQGIIDITGRWGRVNSGLRIDSQKYLFFSIFEKIATKPSTFWGHCHVWLIPCASGLHEHLDDSLHHGVHLFLVITLLELHFFHQKPQVIPGHPRAGRCRWVTLAETGNQTKSNPALWTSLDLKWSKHDFLDI